MPYKDPRKRKEAVRKSVRKYRSDPRNRAKEEEYRKSARGREINARAQKRWRWRHFKQVGDRRIEILSHTKNQKILGQNLRSMVRGIETYGKRKKKDED